MRKAPWPDYAGNDIHEGDRIQHPDGTVGMVAFFEFEDDPGDQWRVVYDNGDRKPGWTANIGRLCLQVGDKGRALVMVKNMENDNPKKETGGRSDGFDTTELVILPPYVEPEHRHLIEKAETALAEYSEYLLEKIKGELFDHGWNIEPHPADVRKAEICFHEDRMRMHLVKQLVNIRAMCERPRFLIRSTTRSQPDEQL